MVKANVHLGHKAVVSRTQSKSFIAGQKDGYTIINLNETRSRLQVLLNVLAHLAYRGAVILFITIEPCFESLVQNTALESGEYYITDRVPRGTFTNFLDRLPAPRLPDFVVFLPVGDNTEIMEVVHNVTLASIPSAGIVDTDVYCPKLLYPIPGNDDSNKAMEYYCRMFTKAILTGKAKKKEYMNACRNTTVDPMGL